ncbi:MAG: choline dehydrogenase [Spirochaeta sp.]|nr:choline dehydrogenase [Spirochaeta sp.]
MKKAIVVGSGAGGATVARELQGKFSVTILEAGREFRPFALNLSLPERLKKSGLFFDERLIQLLCPAMKIRKSNEGLILVNGVALGGSTALSTGSAVRVDQDLKELGIDLDVEFEEIYREIPVSTGHLKLWHKTTKRLFEICKEMNLAPRPTPKMVNYDLCLNCGRCTMGCPQGAKWDSRQFLQTALDGGAHLITSCRVEKVLIKEGMAAGVQARMGWQRKFFPADLIILAAGGLATPLILQNSGIACDSNLFVDPVLCVAAEWKESLQNKEIPMPFIVQKENFILAPYFDHLSFFFNKDWKFPARNTLGIMIKLADSNTGTISGKKIQKALTEQDKKRLAAGVEICTDILTRLGVEKDRIFLGSINAGHPGGMLRLTRQEAETLHNGRLPENLYVADATLFPESTGNPPILTIIALAKRISKLCS